MRRIAVNIRTLPEQKALIDQAAQVSGKTRSEFMLESACDRARDVLLDQSFFSLSKDAFAQFNALLDDDAANPALEQLMARKPQWNT